MSKEVYKFESHVSTPMGGKLPWRYCKHCGLVFLKNDISRLCVKLGCNYYLNKDYISYWRK